jgi:hypothetical protein
VTIRDGKVDIALPDVNGLGPRSRVAASPMRRMWPRLALNTHPGRPLHAAQGTWRLIPIQPWGDLEKLKQPTIVGIFGVNSTESNREQTGIIGGQIWDA